MALAIRIGFFVAAVILAVAGDYIWHDVPGEYTRTIICNDTFMIVSIDDPEFMYKLDQAPTRGRFTLAWTDAAGFRRKWWRNSTFSDKGNTVNGIETTCDGAWFISTTFKTTLNPASDGTGVTDIFFYKGSSQDGTDDMYCGSTLVETDITGDSVPDFFEWTSPIITVNYNAGLHTSKDYHLSATCTWQSAATVESVDIGAIGREPDLVTSFGSQFADLTMTVYRYQESSGTIKLVPVSERDLVPVGQRMFVSIDLFRHTETDDVGIKHFQCWADPAYNGDPTVYDLIDGGCPKLSADSNDMSQELRVFVDQVSSSVQLRWYYDHFGPRDAALYKLVCVVELCTPSLANDCDNTMCSAQGSSSPSRRRRKRQADDKYFTVEAPVPVLQGDVDTTSFSDNVEEGPVRQPVPKTEDVTSSCPMDLAFLLPLAILGLLILVLLVLTGFLLTRLRHKTAQETVTVHSNMYGSRHPRPSTISAISGKPTI